MLINVVIRDILDADSKRPSAERSSPLDRSGEVFFYAEGEEPRGFGHAPGGVPGVRRQGGMSLRRTRETLGVSPAR
ncbi:hypothetical protein GCM10023194_26950 [Planotetraspora phitsanulokensis]|uniref:Uncharacterized protein n=1 Tax=Planotetraspora phitsanulokensis TaxID=575192 RepID=A0A8J3XJL1_9ACTN|nr:hypothetical protein Pph01_83130 [Planotetraspora phitsanulokensis]